MTDSHLTPETPEPPRAPIHPVLPGAGPRRRRTSDEDGVRTKPLAWAILGCGVAAVLTAMLTPEAPGPWYDALARPPGLVPDLVLLLLGVGYYVVFAIALYRGQVHLDEPARRVVLGLLGGVMLLQAAWNPVLVRMESLSAGIVATGVLAGGLMALVVILARRDRVSAAVLLPYAALALHDFWWARELAQLNAG
jgi:translocator protein